MKRAIFLFAVFCALAGTAGAQQIKASPFEGRWVWNGKGTDEPDFSELIFCGNVMMGLFTEDYPVYDGWFFTYTGSAINIGGDYYKWEYRFAGNVLTITDEYDDRYFYTKSVLEKSPIEGIWKISEKTNDELEGYYFLFTGNIIAMGDETEFEGHKIEFRGRTFHPSLSLLGNDVTEKQLAEESIEYRISGRSMILKNSEGEEITVTKIY